MDPRASETLLQDFKRRARRFRRRVRRRNRPDQLLQNEPEQQAAGNPVNLAEDLNQAINLGDDESNDEVGVVGGDDQDLSDTWSHDRIDHGREMDRLEQILLKENAEFHLHC